jgi:hypothetical protein
VIQQNVNSAMAAAEVTSSPFPTRTSTTFEVQQWMEQWHCDHQCLPTSQELDRIKWDGYYILEASGEDLQHALEHWGSSDVKAKMIFHTILRERKKANNPPGHIFGDKGLLSQNSVHLSGCQKLLVRHLGLDTQHIG